MTRVAPMLEKDIAGEPAWTREHLSPRNWEVPLPAAAVHELQAVLDQLQQAPAPVESLRPDAFRLEACAGAMRQVHARLVRGIGMAIVDRLPVESYTVDENRTVAWLLASLLGRVVAQKQHGVFLYDVRDTGQSLEIRCPPIVDESPAAVPHGRSVAHADAGLRRSLLPAVSA